MSKEICECCGFPERVCDDWWLEEMIGDAELDESRPEVMAMSKYDVPKCSGPRKPTHRTREDRTRRRHGGGGKKKGMYM
jgi:hypothetical protein